MGRRFPAAVVWACAAVLVMTTAALPAPTPTAVITHTDRLGRRVEIPVPVKRAVFLQMYELIPVLDVWEKVAGLGRYAFVNDIVASSRAHRHGTVPAVGGGNDINVEAVIRVRPDLIVTWTASPEQVRFLEGKGLRVIAEYPESIQELREVMKLLGRVFQRERRVSRAIGEMDLLLGDIRARVAKAPPSPRPRVLWLGSRPTTVACRNSIGNELIRLVGGENPAEAIPLRNTDIPLERIISWNPDIVFIWGNARYGARHILESSHWRTVNAVKHGRVYKLPEWSTWSPRVALVALWMAMRTYPERFEGLDFSSVADRFYRLVFGLSYKGEGWH
ncbi:MAG TPA: ABC transporter substrate-binding protein [Syntrophales bacterium]|nr:ABC transporter substrate-binding protein [Syntrophales bacterium]